MAVSVTWSSSNGGSAISEPLDHGDAPVGGWSTPQEVFLSHDGNNPITNCGFYLVNTDLGTDLAQVVFWGNQNTANEFGGFLLNMDAEGLYPTWSAYNDKYGTNYNVFRTGAGDSRENAIQLPVAMGLTGAAGVIQTGTAPNVRFKCRLNVPFAFYDYAWVDIEFRQKMRFSYTS
jgi:hypothetical protein